jgi:hypothetical protein
MSTNRVSFAAARRLAGRTAPGSRLMLAGVVFFSLSIGTLVWSEASEWLHHRLQQGVQPTEPVPDRFDLARPPALVRAPPAP